MQMDDVVERYIKLRDAKDKLRAHQKAEMAKLDTVMDQLEVMLLAELNDKGLEAAKTSHGTVYKSVKTQAGVADWDALLSYIQANGLWTMLERRVSKDAVVQFREANNDLPPGVNWREEVSVNIRRSA